MDFIDVESARQKYNDKTKKYWRVAWIILAIIVLFAVLFVIISGKISLFSIMPTIMMLFMGLVISAVIISLLTSKDAALYRKTYKAYFVEKNLQQTFTNLQYNHDAGIGKEVLKNTGMVNTGDRYSSNDLTIAKYRDVSFMQADAHIEEEHTDSDGDTTYVTIFRGRFMIFEFPKKFNFRLEVVGKGFGAYRIFGKDANTGRKASKISTESTDFNKSFRIFGDDGFEAYYILDPAFMEKIQAIGERYKYRLMFGFLNNQLIVGLNDGKDSFEPPAARKPLDEQVELKKISDDIHVITDFVDKLSLDRKLFKN